MRDRSPIRLRAPLLAHRGDHGAVRNGLTVVLAKYRPGGFHPRVIEAQCEALGRRLSLGPAAFWRPHAARPGRVSASTPEPLRASTNGRDKVPIGADVPGAS